MRTELVEQIGEAISAADGPRPAPLREWLAEIEAWRIRHALERNRYNRTSAARELGIGRRTLYTKMEKLGISTPGGAASIQRASA